MTVEEALEYLNLPAKPRTQLVRKRYLELKRDYLKAIYNAPSDHFCTLYQENLEKIEEAYLLLSGSADQVEHGIDIQETIEELQNLANTLQDDKIELTPEARTSIEQYIVQIDHLKQELSLVDQPNEPVNLSMPSSRWDVKHSDKVDPDNLKKRKKLVSTSKKSSDIKSVDTRQTNVGDRNGKEDPLRQKPGVQPASVERGLFQTSTSNLLFLEDWLVQRIIGRDHQVSSVARKKFYSQLVMGIILAIVILSALGLLYIIFPLMSET